MASIADLDPQTLLEQYNLHHDGEGRASGGQLADGKHGAQVDLLPGA